MGITENILYFPKDVLTANTKFEVGIVTGFYYFSGLWFKLINQWKDVEDFFDSQVRFFVYISARIHIYVYTCMYLSIHSILLLTVIFFFFLIYITSYSDFTGEKLWLKLNAKFGKKSLKTEEQLVPSCSRLLPREPIHQYPLKDKYLISMSNTQIDNEVIFCFVCLFLIM